MVLKNGIKRVRKDHRDFSFKRTFGAVSPDLFPDEFSSDAGFGFPDQDADGLPNGCSGYTQSELCQDEDGTRYKPAYTYRKTQLMEGTWGQDVGCDLRDSLKSLIVYGPQAPNENTDDEAALHRRGQYFNVLDPFNGFDAFDDVRNALWKNRLERRSVSVGSPWFPEWLTVPESGVLPTPSFDLSQASWHNWKVYGWKQINGEPYLMAKPWCGPNFGDHGTCYFSREIFNKLMAIDGSAAFTIAKAKLDDIQYIRLTIIETILSYVRMLIQKYVAA